MAIRVGDIAQAAFQKYYLGGGSKQTSYYSGAREGGEREGLGEYSTLHIR